MRKFSVGDLIFYVCHGECPCIQVEYVTDVSETTSYYGLGNGQSVRFGKAFATREEAEPELLRRLIGQRIAVVRELDNVDALINMTQISISKHKGTGSNGKIREG